MSINGLTVPVSGDDMQLPLHDDSDAVAEMLSRARSPLELAFAQRKIKRQDTNGLIGSIVRDQQAKTTSSSAAAAPASSPAKSTSTQDSSPPQNTQPTSTSGNTNTGGTTDTGGTNNSGGTDTGSTGSGTNTNTNTNTNNNTNNNNDTSGSNGAVSSAPSDTSSTPASSSSSVSSSSTPSSISSSASFVAPAIASSGTSSLSSTSTNTAGTPWDAGANVPGGSLTASPGNSMNSSAVGAGVGVTIGVLALLGLLFCLRRRRQRRVANRHAEWAAGSAGSRGPPSEKASSKPSSKQSAVRSIVGWVTRNNRSISDRQSTHSSFASPLTPNRPPSNMSNNSDPFTDKSPASSILGHEKDPFVESCSTVSRPNSAYESTQMSMSPVMFADSSVVEPWIHRGLSINSQQTRADSTSPRSSITSNSTLSRTISLPPASYNNKHRKSTSTHRTSPSPMGDNFSAIADEEGRYTVQRPFTPTLADELAVSAGDVIKVVRAFDDGWAFCVKADGVGRGLIPLTALSSSSSGSGSGTSGSTGDGDSARDKRRLSMSSIASSMSRTSSLSHQIEDLITAGALNSYI